MGVKERTQRKQINEITSLEGTKLKDHASIIEEIVALYKGLIRSVAQMLQAVNNLTMRKGPILSHQQKLDLCAKVTELEIFKALNSIGDDKSLGVDGYNSYFFQRA